MDAKVNPTTTTKRKREVFVGGGGNVTATSTTKRKMSLRNNLSNGKLKKNDSSNSDIKQITKCVFLGSLCLKPVPHIFDNSTTMLAELDQTNNVFHTNNVNEYTANIQQTLAEKIEAVEKKVFYHNNRKRNAEVLTKNKRKLIRDKTESTIKQETSIKLEDLRQEKNNVTETVSNLLDAMIPPLPPSITLLPLAPQPQIQSTNEVDQQEITELTELTVFQPDSNTHSSSVTIESVSQEMEPSEDDFEQKIMLKKEGTPELVLSDTDDETIDQLMFNIMDIKIEHAVVYGKEFFNMQQSDLEEYPSDYNSENQEMEANEKTDSNESNINNNEADINNDKKKYIRPKPRCKICSQVFTNLLDLKQHKMQHNGDKPYLCSKCGENHKTLDQLLAHLRTHQGKRPYVCKKCNQGFKTVKGLENHQSVHILRKVVVVPKKTFPCDICKREFHKLCDLERHTRVHTGEKPSVCNICNRRFQQTHNLNKHLIIHTQEKPYQCDICNKRFGRNDVLNRHLLTHSVKKPNRCEICMKSFIRASQLMLHMEKHHGKGGGESSSGNKHGAEKKQVQNDLCI